MPKWQRILALIVHHNKQNLIRIRYDWGREMLVLSSTGILLGLFYYIFHDFLHTKLNDLPESLRQGISTRLMATVLLGLGAWIAGRLAQLFKDQPGWALFALRSGEQPSVVDAFRRCQALLILVLSYGFFWLALAPSFVHWSLQDSVILQSSSLAIAALLFFFMRKNPAPGPSKWLQPILNDKLVSRAQTLRTWRWYQMLRRNRLCRLCLGLSAFVQILIGIMHGLGWPLFLCVLATMLASALLAWAVAFQLEEDMRAVWFERQLGCSHEEFVRVYQELCWFLGLGLALLSLALALIGGVAAREPASEWLKLLPIACLFPVITPSIMFQVAPDRPLLQILITSLIGLFLGTAIYANVLAIFLVAVAIHYAKTYQKDNFYRS